MEAKLQSVVQCLQERFPLQVEEFRGEAHVFVQAEHLLHLLEFLKTQEGFEMLSTVTAVDYWPQQQPRFHVIYQLLSLQHNLRLQVRVPVNATEPVLPTITSIYANASWREREVWDMFGIRFQGHPDLRRILMPQDWQGHPLRKDYPLGYEEPQFTFNFEEINQRKPYAKE